MSQQQTHAENAEESEVILMEQMSSNRQKKRCENNSPQRSESPAVQPDEEEFKPSDNADTNRENITDNSEGQTKSPKKMKSKPFSSEKIKQNILKTSSIPKKNQNESIPMTSTVVEPKKLTTTPSVELALKSPGQPIPPDVTDTTDIEFDNIEKDLDKKTNEEESSFHQITEIRTQSKHSIWISHESIITEASYQNTKKKQISWHDDEYLNKVYLKSMEESSRAVGLERKASVGPLKCATPFTRASGLTLCVPKKSTRNISSNDTTAGINISISKKSLANSKSGVVIRNSYGDVTNSGDAQDAEKRAVKIDIEVPYMRIFKVVRSKLGFVRNKFHPVRNLSSS